MIKDTVKIQMELTTYWPTKIIKSVGIKKTDKDTVFHNDITLNREQAEYIYEQLKSLFEKTKPN